MELKEPASAEDAARRLRRALLRSLEHEAGTDQTTSVERAAAAGRLFNGLFERLSPVIGALGVRALALRAVALSKRQFAFLDERVVPLDRGDGFGEPLRACLQEQEPDVVTEAALTLFATAVNLLVTAIGEQLARSLLKDVWPDIRYEGPEYDK